MINQNIIEKSNQNIKKITTNSLITLCEIKENYKSFSNDLEEIIRTKKDKDYIIHLYDAICGKKFFGINKYKNFIEKHKDTIEIMKNYSCLSEFTIYIYNSKGEKIDKNIDYFYQYIQEHKKDIETIKEIALKLKELKFKNIEFGETLDFTKTKFKLDNWEKGFIFTENIEICPTYTQIPIEYKTTKSCYCMYIDCYINGRISNYNRSIKLNSLTFNPNRLPTEISRESTINVIEDLAEEQKLQHNDLKNAINFNTSTDDLRKEFEHLKNLTQEIDKVKDNKELKELLTQIQNLLSKLQLFGLDFENQIIDSHESITEEVIEKEKKRYLKLRKESIY